MTGVVRGDNAPGDFAQALTTRLGYAVSANEPYWFSGCTTTTQCVFPGQVIPQSGWSSAAKGLLQFVPLPVGNLGGTPFFSTSANKSTVVDNKGAARIDFNTQRMGTWSAYYHMDNANVLLPYASAVGNGANAPGFPAITPSRAQQFNLSNTRNFGGSMVNEARINYTREALIWDKPNGGLGSLSSYGFLKGGLGINPTVPAYEGSPTVSLNLMGLTWGVPEGTTGQYNNTFQISDNFSKIVGRHTLKFGGDGRYLQINERNTYTENGYYQFSGGETGNDFADYLLGAPDFFNQTSQQFLDSRTRYYGFYAQDTYKIKPSLTLNYGLRWEVSEPFYDSENKIMTIQPGVQSHVYPDAPTGLAYPTDDNLPRGMAPTGYHNWGPRVGLAYSPTSTSGLLGKLFGGPGKTSIRAAFGIYHTSVEDETLFWVVGNPPFGLWYVSPTLVYMEEPYKDRLRNNDPGQRFPYAIPAPGSNVSFNDLLPISFVQFTAPNNTLPISEHFNFNIQREIKNSAVLTVGYVGTQGHHLPALHSMNPGNPALCLHIAALYAGAGQAGQGCGPYGEDSIYQIDGQTFNGTRPFSVTSGRALDLGRLDFGEDDYFSTLSNSDYNALQVTLEKKVGPLRFLTAYTWSKSLDNGSGTTEFINPYNPHLSRAISAFDMTQNFVTSYTYDLPFQRMTSSSPAVVRKLLEGWALTGITRFATGQPVNIMQSGDLSLCNCSTSDYPNWTGTPVQFSNPRSSSRHQYFSSDPFFSEVLGVGGDAGRRFFHGPGLNNWDMALHKSTHISERVSLEFRAEFFNIFNHAQFNNPVGDFASSSFGLVTSARDPRIGQMALKLHF